jgi:hypothetical protein
MTVPRGIPISHRRFLQTEHETLDKKMRSGEHAEEDGDDNGDDNGSHIKAPRQLIGPPECP